MKKTLCVLVLLCGCGCAMKPEKIQPAYVSEVAYREFDCPDLLAERCRLADALHIAAERQRGARVYDAVGIALICVPLGTLGGDNCSQEIARLKGEIEAVERQADVAGCRLPEIGDPVSKKFAKQ